MSNLHPGVDYIPAGVEPGTGDSNLRWSRGNTPLPINNSFSVTIIHNPEPEPIEIVEVQVECEERENCFLPRSVYTITIVDPLSELNLGRV